MSADFENFGREGGTTPPKAITDQILLRVHGDLNPNPWATFARLAGIHFFTGLVTLSFCPQFGFRILGEGMGLMHYFMGLGNLGCAVACGIVFLGSSVIVASLVLSPDQVRAIRRHRWLELGALTFLSLGVFIMLQTEILLGFALAWLTGSILGGAATLEIGWRMRRKLLSA